MPVPIMFETTKAVALYTPSCLRREGFGEATLMSILRPMELLKLFAAAAGTEIVAARLSCSRRRLRPWTCRLQLVIMTVPMVVFLGLFGFKYGHEAVQTQPLVESEHNQFGFRWIQFGDPVDLAQHALDAPARGLARHGQRVGEQSVISQIVVGLVAIEVGRDFIGVTRQAEVARPAQCMADQFRILIV